MGQILIQKPVTDKDTYWHHCGRCGSLFSAEMTGDSGKVCPDCGQSPSVDAGDSVSAVKPAGQEIQKVRLKQPVERNHRPGRKMLLFLKVFVAWLVVIGLIVLTAHWFKSKDPQSQTQVPVEKYVGSVELLHDQDRKLLEVAVPVCRKVLVDFLSAKRASQRLELVIHSEVVAERLANYYEMPPPLTTEPEQLNLQASTVVHLPEGDTVLTQWDSPEGLRFDAAFRQVDSVWKLDWDHFTRHSECNWALFLAGSGPDEAEFRLLARERYQMEGNAMKDCNVMLYAPEMKRFDDAGLKAAVMPLPGDSRDAKLLRAAFQSMRDGKPLFRSTMRDINPQDMIRVRVRVKRVDAPGRNRFEIVRVLACHWYSSKAWGVLPEDADEDGNPGADGDEAAE